MSGDEPLPVGRSVFWHDLGVSQSCDAPSADLQIDFRKLLFPEVKHYTEHCRASHRSTFRVIVVDETEKDLERQAGSQNQMADGRKGNVPPISRNGKIQNLSSVYDNSILAVDRNAIMTNHSRPVISLGINVQIA